MVLRVWYQVVLVPSTKNAIFATSPPPATKRTGGLTGTKKDFLRSDNARNTGFGIKTVRDTGRKTSFTSPVWYQVKTCEVVYYSLLLNSLIVGETRIWSCGKADVVPEEPATNMWPIVQIQKLLCRAWNSLWRGGNRQWRSFAGLTEKNPTERNFTVFQKENTLRRRHMA